MLTCFLLLRTCKQEVAELQAHARRLEEESADASARVNEMRVDMIRGSMAAPESIMRILSDYPQVWAGLWVSHCALAGSLALLTHRCNYVDQNQIQSQN